MFPAPLTRLVEAPATLLGHRVHGLLPSTGLAGLDPDVARVCAATRPVDPRRLPVRALRAAYRLQTMLWNRERETEVDVEDAAVNRHVTVRTYRPYVERSVAGLVYFHGGGMVIGDLETHDRWCRWAAVRAGIVVHAVEYRLAPEHPFPAGCRDAVAAWNHVVAGWQAQGRPLDALGVGGDSAGGYLAMVVATQAIDPTLQVPVAARPAFQWLLYPAVDLVTRIGPAVGEFPAGVLHTDAWAARFTREWLRPGDDPASPAHSPGLVDDHVLEQLAPTHLLTCQFDPLRLENERFLERLEGAGVAVTHQHLATLPHEFISTTGVSAAAEQAGGECIDALATLATPVRPVRPR